MAQEVAGESKKILAETKDAIEGLDRDREGYELRLKDATHTIRYEVERLKRDVEVEIVAVKERVQDAIRDEVTRLRETQAANSPSWTTGPLDAAEAPHVGMARPQGNNP
jgi:hypothetical protein